MLIWSSETLHLKLRYNWKISRNETTEKQNLIIKVSDGKITGRGEAAPNIRYKESIDKLLIEFSLFREFGVGINNPKELYELMNSLTLSNSLKFAIESAYLHYFTYRQSISICEYFKINPVKKVFTSYTLPIMETGKVKEFIDQYDLGRFKFLKIKINSETAEELISEVSNNYSGSLWIDANEAYKDPDQFLSLTSRLKNKKIDFIEQPFPSELVDEYKYLRKKSVFEIIADESITDHVSDIEGLKDLFHGINMKLMKAGGYDNGLKILNEAKRLGLKTMIGCMIETTLGISSAMHLSEGVNYIDLDGFFVIENEPFNLVEEENGLLFLKRNEL